MREFARVSFSDRNGTYHYILCWELIRQDTAGNYSEVKLQAIIQVNGVSNNYIMFDRGNATLNAVGFNLRTTPNRYSYGNTVVYEYNVIINHDSNGNASVVVGGTINTSYLMNGSCSGTITLPQISKPQVQPAKITSFYISNLKTDMVETIWKTDELIEQVQYSLNGESWKNTGGAGTWAFVTLPLKSGTSYNLKIRVKRLGTNLWTTSSTLYFTTPSIPTRIRVGGSWKDATPYVRIGGSWKQAEPYIRVNGSWRRCN